MQVTSRNAPIAFFSYPTRKIIHRNVDKSTDEQILVSLGHWTRPRQIAKIAGNAINTINNEVPIPPSIGAAMRFITSEPLPSLNMMGSRPMSSARPVINIGRIRCFAPSAIACHSSAESLSRFSSRAFRQAISCLLYTSPSPRD